MILSDKDKTLIKSLYLKGYTARRLTDEFPEKSWTKRGVNNLFKKLRDTGTVNSVQAVADRAVPALKKTLNFFRSSRSLPLTLFCQLFNCMLRHSFVPSDFRFGSIEPVLKDKHGDITRLICIVI